MSWPSYAEVQASGFRLGQDDSVERTPFDDGMVRQEKRSEAALATAEISAIVGADRLAAFRSWAKRQAHLWFDFPTPLAEGTVRARVRGGAGGITYQPYRARRGALMWEARMTIEGPDL